MNCEWCGQPPGCHVTRCPVTHVSDLEAQLAAAIEGKEHYTGELLAEIRGVRAAHEATRGELDELRLSTNDALDAARDTLAECVAQLAAAKVERDKATAKADAHERDWYAAKAEFGDAMAAQRERLRASEVAHQTTMASLGDARWELANARNAITLAKEEAVRYGMVPGTESLREWLGGYLPTINAKLTASEAAHAETRRELEAADADRARLALPIEAIEAREAETWRTAFSIVKDVSEREERACRRHSAAFAESIPRKTMSLKRAHEMAARQSSAVGAYIEQEMLAARAERGKKT